MARKEEQLAATQRRQEKRNAQVKAANTINALARGWKQRRKIKLQQQLAEEEANVPETRRETWDHLPRMRRPWPTRR